MSSMFNDAYAVLSPEARRLRSQVVLAVRSPASIETGITTRSVELRQQPFAVWLDLLESAAALPGDWDSYGASRVAPAAITTARALLNDLSFRPLAAINLLPFHLAPISTGGVQIEWKRPDGAALELWIDGDGAIDAVFDVPATEPRITEKRLTSLAVAIAEIEAFAA
jgi:hypothetical protein